MTQLVKELQMSDSKKTLNGITKDKKIIPQSERVSKIMKNI